MPDLSYNKRQQKERPSIRQITQEFLSEELQAQLEPFLRYIEEKKFPFSLARCNTYESKYKGRPVFRVEIALGQACVRFNQWFPKRFIDARRQYISQN